ncbi:uncharacterized protein [Rutidosis leptorrhynchoides]|uniref:uncharacterized protein n=1 Tax=Rutidosis leptorrhynchoides TaxID=125765 RepID=UPI003A98D356
MRRIFFWGGSIDNSKISWVKWDNVLLPYKGGGLNIGSLKAKNIALLGKWCWRFRNEKNALWVKIIQSLYGRDGGLGETFPTQHQNKRTPWSNICKTGQEIDSLGIVFSNSFLKEVKNGDSTLLWKYQWIGEQLICDKFIVYSGLKQMHVARYPTE